MYAVDGKGFPLFKDLFSGKLLVVNREKQMVVIVAIFPIKSFEVNPLLNENDGADPDA